MTILAPSRELLTFREAADVLRVSLSTLERLVAAGRLPVVRVSNRRRLVTAADLERYIARQRERR